MDLSRQRSSTGVYPTARGIYGILGPAMPKLTVYLPDELVARLEPFRSKLNLSEIAKMAIEENQRREQATVGDRRAAVVNRFRRIEDGRRGVQVTGEDDGRRWAETVASWDDVKEVAGWPDLLDVSQLIRERPPVETGPFAGLSALSLSPPLPTAFIPPSVKAEPPAQDEDTVMLFWTGFRSGAQDVFQLVKDDIEPPS
jgi:post-segregation antitoxin (ccd killing protein)